MSGIGVKLFLNRHSIVASSSMVVSLVFENEPLRGAVIWQTVRSVGSISGQNGPRLVRVRGILWKESCRLAARLAIKVANCTDLATVHRQMNRLVISK